jgi:hypothetical protein
MVHRILGPWLLGASLLLGLGAAPRAALGYCRTTTCAVQNPPPQCGRDAYGCSTSGIPLFWRQQCLSYDVGQDGSPRLGLDYAGALALVEKGFNLWPTAMCSTGSSPSIAFMTLGPLMCEQREYNPTGPNANAVLFRDTGWTHDASAIALTTVVFNSKTGEILDADMEIDTENYLLSPLDVEYTVGHESGHFLGLDHSSDPTALMYYQYSSTATTDPVLRLDDVLAICTAYPTNRDVPACDFEPAKGFATDCGGNVIASCAVPAGQPSRSSLAAGLGLGALGAVAAVARGRRRRRRR